MAIPSSPTEQLAYATARIESHYPNGNVGTGTGFFFDLATTGSQRVPVLITNKHVVEGATKGKFVLTERAVDKGPARGSYVAIDVLNFAQQWIPHPDSSVDLCVMPIAPIIHQARRKGHEFFYNIVQDNFLPTPEEIEDYVGLEEIVMVGYPNGLWDQVNNQPIFRRGVLGSDYRNDWNGKKECLIDAACFPGSSGSPVFLFNPFGYQTREGVIRNNGRIKLLGVLYGGFQFTVQGEIRVVAVPTQQQPVSVSSIPMNLGLIIKAERLRDFQANVPGMFAGLIARHEELPPS